MFVFLGGTASAMAADDPYRFSLERLALAPTSESSLFTSAGSLLEPGTMRLALTGHYEREPLTVWLDGQRVGALVRDRFTSQLSAAYALERVELGFELPMLVRQKGDALGGYGFAQPISYGLESPRLRARMGLLEERLNNPLNLAADFEVVLPFGVDQALGDLSGWSALARVSMGKRLGPVLLALQGGVSMRRNQAVRPYVIGTELPVLATLSSTGSGVRAELSVQAAIPLTREPAPMELLGGVRCPVSRRFEFFAVSGIGFNSTPGTPTYRVLTGVRITALEPGYRASAPRTMPEPVVPMRFADPAPAREELLLEAPKPLEPVAVASRADAPQDKDSDSVPDGVDNCPGIAGPASNQGCPAIIRQIVVITANRLELREKIFFAPAKDRILRGSRALLAQVASVLNNHPELSRVFIEGHTDSRGKAQVNRALSTRRAEAVRQALIERGVEDSRLVAIGHGPDQPLASNRTPLGREQNRRVELNLVPPQSTLASTQVSSK